MEEEIRRLKTFVADTHTLLWYLLASPQLGANAKRALDDAARDEAVILIPSIAIAELFYTVQKSRVLKFAEAYQQLRRTKNFIFVPLEADDILDFEPHSFIPEMHDRIIVGVARRSGATLLTRDIVISRSGIPVLW